MNAMRSRWAGSILAWTLNTKTGQLVLARLDCSTQRGPRLRPGRMIDELVEQRNDAEIVQRRTEKTTGVCSPAR